MASPDEIEKDKKERWAVFRESLKRHYEKIAKARAAGGYLEEFPPAAPSFSDRPKGSAKPGYEFPVPEKAEFYKAQLEKVYGWQRENISEANYMRQFVDESKKRGVTKDQMVGVYSIETGGEGKYDDKASNSSAIGYTQFLNTTTMSMIELHGQKYAEVLRAAGKQAEAKIILDMQKDLKKIDDLFKTAPALPHELRRNEKGEREYDPITHTRTPRTKEGRFQWFANLDEQISSKTGEKRVPDDHPLAQYRNKGKAMHGVIMTQPLGPIMQASLLADMSQKWKAKGLKEEPSGAQLEFLNIIGDRALPIIASLAPNGDRKAAQLPITNFVNMDGYIANPTIQRRHTEPQEKGGGTIIGGTGENIISNLEEKIKRLSKNSGTVALVKAYDQSTAKPTDVGMETKKPARTPAAAP